MEITRESLFSIPTASRYGSAERRFRTRTALLATNSNFPVASTLKSDDCSTTTAALPSPKWLRSTRFAAASQSGTESARLTEPRSAQIMAPISRHACAAAENLLPAEHHDFLIVFGNLIEELPGVHILHIGLELRLF